MTDLTTTAHATAEALSLMLTAAGIEPDIIAEAMVTTGLAFFAAKDPESAAVLTGAFFEAANGR